MELLRTPSRLARLLYLALLGALGCDGGSGGEGPDLEWRVSSGTNASAAPWGVAVDGTGRVIVTELFGDQVDVFTSTGSLLLRFGSAGSNQGNLDGPKYVDADAAGNLYVVDAGNHRVQKFSSTGAFLAQ